MTVFAIVLAETYFLKYGAFVVDEDPRSRIQHSAF